MENGWPQTRMPQTAPCLHDSLRVVSERTPTADLDSIQASVRKALAMPTRVDRVQVVVADRRAAAAAYTRLLDAQPVREDAVRSLAARRSILRVGGSEIELLEPDGAGVVSDFLAQTNGGLFAAGLATRDLARLRAHLRAARVEAAEEHGQLFLSPDALGMPGLRAVISSDVEQAPAGFARHLYEVTWLVHDFSAMLRKVAAVLALEATHFVPIRSGEFGYDGTLTLFHPQRLDRIEIVTPNEPSKTMGRFFAKRGPCLYMCFAEADDLRPIRARLLEHAPDDWTGPRDVTLPDSLFIHPRALAGMMLGVSRTSFAWTWSGHPERVVAAHA